KSGRALRDRAREDPLLGAGARPAFGPARVTPAAHGQVGALLKSNSAGNPLAGFPVTALALTGYSQTAGYMTTYINAVATHAVLADGALVYDAYMPIAGARFPTPINNCAASPVRGSDRWVIQTPGSAPVIAIQTLSDFYPL